MDDHYHLFTETQTSEATPNSFRSGQSRINKTKTLPNLLGEY